MRAPLIGVVLTVLLATSGCSDDETSPTDETVAASVATSDTTIAPPETTVSETTVAETATTAVAATTTVAVDPPVADCPEVGPEEVELVITDNGVLYAGEPVPICLTVTADRTFILNNNAEGDANVKFGTAFIEIFAGNTADSSVSAQAAPGESFDITVLELATTITVQVVAA